MDVLHVIAPASNELKDINLLKGDLTPDEDTAKEKIISVLEGKVKDHVPSAVPVEIHIRKGDVSEKILSFSDETEPLCTVIGNHDEHGLMDKLTGTTTSDMIQKSERPIVVCSEGFKPTKRFNKILVPADPDFGISEIQKFYSTYLKSDQPEIQLLSVVPGDSSPQLIASFKDYLQKQKAAFIRAGSSKVEIRLTISDDPADAILQSIQTDMPDLVMMNTHGRESLSKLFRGSVTEQVMNRSLVPVFTYRPDRTEPEMAATAYNHSWFPV